jgi:hypothetical protein
LREVAARRSEETGKDGDLNEFFSDRLSGRG